MRRTPLIIGISLGVVLLVLVGVRLWKLRQQIQQGQQLARTLSGPPSVSTGECKLRTITWVFDPVGTVQSEDSVELAAKSTGRILYLQVRQGDHVKRGQVLVKIDSDEAEGNLLKARSSLANARYTYAQLLAERQLTNVQASTGVIQAQADLAAAQATLEKSDDTYEATVDTGRANQAQARSSLVAAQAQHEQARVELDKSMTHYNRMLDLQKQGFASGADVQDAYRDVLSKRAAVEQQRAQVDVSRANLESARSGARKDATAARADIRQAELQIASKQAGLAQAQASTAKASAYEDQLSAQLALVQAAEADLAVAEARMQDTTLRSPIDGLVSDRKMDVGSLASAGSPILTLQASNRVWVVVSIPQELYSGVNLGDRAEVTVDGFPGRTFEGKIRYKDPAVDVATRQFNVRIHIDNPKGEIRPGMFARVELDAGDLENVLTVPNSALRDKDTDKRTATVYKVTQHKVHPVQVSYGQGDSRFTVILSGLEAGDRVVTQTAAPLTEGQSVRDVPDTDGDR